MTIKYSKNGDWIPHAIRRTKKSIERFQDIESDSSGRKCNVCDFAKKRIGILWVGAPFDHQDNNFCQTITGLICPARPYCKAFVRMIDASREPRLTIRALKRHLKILEAL